MRSLRSNRDWSHYTPKTLILYPYISHTTHLTQHLSHNIYIVPKRVNEVSEANVVHLRGDEQRSCEFASIHNTLLKTKNSLHPLHPYPSLHPALLYAGLFFYLLPFHHLFLHQNHSLKPRPVSLYTSILLHKTRVYRKQFSYESLQLFPIYTTHLSHESPLSTLYTSYYIT